MRIHANVGTLYHVAYLSKRCTYHDGIAGHASLQWMLCSFINDQKSNRVITRLLLAGIFFIFCIQIVYRTLQIHISISSPEVPIILIQINPKNLFVGSFIFNKKSILYYITFYKMKQWQIYCLLLILEIIMKEVKQSQT